MNKIHLYDKIISPVVTEKSTNLSDQNKIVFKVRTSSNKSTIKKSIEKIRLLGVEKLKLLVTKKQS